MNNSAIDELNLMAIDSSLVCLYRERRVVRAAFPVSFNDVLINVDDCFHIIMTFSLVLDRLVLVKACLIASFSLATSRPKSL